MIVKKRICKEESDPWCHMEALWNKQSSNMFVWWRWTPFNHLCCHAMSQLQLLLVWKNMALKAPPFLISWKEKEKVLMAHGSGAPLMILFMMLSNRYSTLSFHTHTHTQKYQWLNWKHVYINCRWHNTMLVHWLWSNLGNNHPLLELLQKEVTPINVMITTLLPLSCFSYNSNRFYFQIIWGKSLFREDLQSQLRSEISWLKRYM